MERQEKERRKEKRRLLLPADPQSVEEEDEDEEEDQTSKIKALNNMDNILQEVNIPIPKEEAVVPGAPDALAPRAASIHSLRLGLLDAANALASQAEVANALASQANDAAALVPRDRHSRKLLV